MTYNSDYVDSLRMILETGDTPLLGNILMGLRLEGRMLELQKILSEILEDRQLRDLDLKSIKPKTEWTVGESK